MANNRDLTAPDSLQSQFRWAYKRPPAQEPYYTYMPQPAPPTPWGRIFGFGAAAGGLFGAGFAKIGNKRLFDYVHTGLQYAEEASPGKILRTFQLSDRISPFTSALSNVTIPAGQLAHPRTQEFLANMLGTTMHEAEATGMFARGLEFTRTGALFGTLKVAGSEGAVLSKAAIPMGVTRHAGGTFADWYARVSGVNLGFNETLLAGEVAGSNILFTPKIDKVLGIPIPSIAQGFMQRASVLGRMNRAYWALQVGRLNRLLATPLELVPSLGSVLSKAGLPSLTVKPGTATAMLGRYAMLGLGIGGAVRGAQYLSYLRSQQDNRLTSGLKFGALGGVVGGLLRRTPFGAMVGAGIGLTAGVAPVFDRGFIPGVGTMTTRASLAYSRFSESTGLTQSAREQEALMPGVTKLQTLAGFAGAGLMLGSFAGYGIKVSRYLRSTPKATTEWLESAERLITAKRARGLTSTSIIKRLGARLGGIVGAGAEGGISERLMLRGGRIGALAGAGLFTGLAMGAAIGTGHLLPGIVGSKYTPEELRQFYSGEREVPVRAGRWWEAGRCLTKSTTYILFDGTTKTSDQLQIGDVLIGRDFKPAVVTNIHVRYHTGTVRTFFTAFDRDISTGVTDEHIIPVLQDGEVYEIRAGKLQINQFVECAYKKLDNTLSSLDPIDHLQVPVIIKDNRIFATQHNWFTGNLQQSGTTSIPTTLDLDYDLGLLFGYYLAEGSIGFRQGNPTMIELCFAVSESEYVDDIVRIVQEKFQTQPTVRHKTTDKKTKDGCLIIRICNSVLAKLFRWLFYQQEYDAHQKDIPSFLDSANNSFKAGLIEGYWRGDGHYDHGTKVITSARKWLLQHVQLWALNLGQACGISPHSNENPSWRLRFYVANSTNAGCMFIEERLFSRVRQIHIDEYNDLVYDFEVNDPDHLLQAGTFLVHNSRWEGGRAYYRPHWYRLMQTRARDIGAYGTEAEKWESSPLLHPIKYLTDEKFRYKWELEHYQDRPYPMTGAAGSNVPFLAPVAETFGSIIKPPRLMHTSEWLTRNQYGEVGTLRASAAGENPPAFGMDATFSGQPVSRYTLDQQTGELIYRLQELRGLPGFIHSTIKEQLTGSPDYFDQYEQVATSDRAIGLNRGFWNLQLGGGLLSTEAIRRYLPHARNQIEQYNPLRNTMPSWMPSSNYFVDFTRGDPYTKVVEGEIRLPGPGYAALHPELYGVAPEDYPTFHRFKILSDVALWSDEFKQSQHQVRAAIKRGELSQPQIAQVDEINRLAKERKQRKKIDEYRFSRDTLEKQRVTIKEHIGTTGLMRTTTGAVIGMGGIDTKGYRRQQARVSDFLREHVEPGAEMDIFVHRDPAHRYKKLAGVKDTYYMPAVLDTLNKQALTSGIVTPTTDKTDPFSLYSKYNPAQRALGSLWENIAHKESPLEYLTPFSPMAKFVHQRSAIEEYERSRVWGTEASFWQHPFKHFIQPATQMAEREWGGTEKIPQHVRERWAVEEYFDKLKYLKYRGLEEAAKNTGNIEAINEFRQQQRRTLVGTNPFGNPSAVFAAMPALDRDYFKPFVDAQTVEERRTILGMVAPNQRAIYTAQWERQAEVSLRAQQSMGMGTAEATTHLQHIQQSRMAEGRPVSEELLAEYEATRQEDERYADWSRRKEIEQYFQKAPLPKSDWCMPGDSLILTDHGYVPIQDIQIQDYVMTRQGLRRVVQCFVRDVDEDLIRIAVKNDQKNTLLVTKEHPVFVNGQFIPAQNVRPGDFLYGQIPDIYQNILDLTAYIPLDKYQFNDLYITSRLSGPKQITNRFIKLTDDLYWLFGWFLAEGNIWIDGSRMRGIEFTLNLQEEETAQEISRIVFETFGRKAKIYHRYRKTGSCLTVKVNSQVLGYVFMALCGRWSDQKTPCIPGTQEQLCTTAFAFLAGDGSWEKHRVTGNTISPQIALWLRDVLYTNGFKVSYRVQDREHRKPSHRVAVYWKQPWQCRVVQSATTERFVGKVYNLLVEESNEFFTTIGLVHNCGWHPTVDLEDIKLQVVENLGHDMHDYNLWEGRKRDLVHKPYLDQEAPLAVSGPNNPQLQAAMTKVLRESLRLQNVQVSVLPAPAGEESVEVEIEDERTEVFERYKRNPHFMNME